MERAKYNSEKRLMKYYGFACIPFIFIPLGFLVFLFTLSDSVEPFNQFLFYQAIFIILFPYLYINLISIIIVIMFSKLMQKPKVNFIHIADIGFAISIILFIYWTFFHDINLGEGGA